jgi:hypothetical protein|tara:strand:+ start:3899 stop:4324 length:426 start_codon:yes stop_codon:yes gene_type:complete
MADDKLHSQITYDFTKDIKDIDINPAYIHGLQRITNTAIINSDRGADMPGIFAKFEEIVTQHTKPEEGKVAIVLDEFEADIYTLFSLIQLFKYKAHEQGLELETETTVTKDELVDLAKMIEKGEDITEALKHINSQMTIVK